MPLSSQLAESDAEMVDFMIDYVDFLTDFEGSDDPTITWTIKERALIESFLLIKQMIFYYHRRDLFLEEFTDLLPYFSCSKKRFALVCQERFSKENFAFNHFQAIFDDYFSRLFFPPKRVILSSRGSLPSVVWKNLRSHQLYFCK